MVNFSPRIEKATEEELYEMINNVSGVYGSMPSNELVKRSILKLEQTLSEFNSEASKQTKKMINLTWLIALLTVVMVIGLIVQIYLSLKVI